MPAEASSDPTLATTQRSSARHPLIASPPGIDADPYPPRPQAAGEISGAAFPFGRSTVNVAGRWHVDRRWHPDGPLHLAATALWLTRRGAVSTGPGCACTAAISAGRTRRTSPGWACATCGAVPSCLTEYGGVEWVEVVHPTPPHPTRTGALDALRITPADRSLLLGADWSPA